MNKAGEVVGSADDSNGDTVAVAINSQGVIVGNADIGCCVGPQIFEIGPDVSASQSILRGINVAAINATNVIVGQEEFFPVIWDGVDVSHNANGGLPTVDAMDSAQPTGIKAAGVIVGVENEWLPDFSDTHPVAVRWQSDLTTVKALQGLGGINSAATAVGQGCCESQTGTFCS
jgi:hypothetical protein